MKTTPLTASAAEERLLAATNPAERSRIVAEFEQSMQTPPPLAGVRSSIADYEKALTETSDPGQRAALVSEFEKRFAEGSIAP